MPNPLVKAPESPFAERFRAGHPGPIDLTDVDLGKSPRFILDRIADLLGADEHAILLFDRSVRTIRGHKSVCLHLLFKFSDAYANLLRATGWARFDGKQRCWYLPEEFVTEELLDETFSGRFTYQLVGEVVPYLSGMGYPDGAEFSIALNGYGWFKQTIDTHGRCSCEDLIRVIRESRLLPEEGIA